MLKEKDFIFFDDKDKFLKILKRKLSAKKYNPATRKHETFVEKKLPPHSK